MNDAIGRHVLITALHRVISHAISDWLHVVIDNHAIKDSAPCIGAILDDVLAIHIDRANSVRFQELQLRKSSLFVFGQDDKIVAVHVERLGSDPCRLAK